MEPEHRRPLQRARGRARVGLRVFFPSSIGAFGPATPQDGTPQDTIQRPTTCTASPKSRESCCATTTPPGIGVDTRGSRFPGLISHGAPPGGGTTDYAVDIFHHAVRHGRYTCFLAPDTQLDMMYMPDAVRAAIELMEADPARLQHRNAYNVTAMSSRRPTSPRPSASTCRASDRDYDIDPVRQAIADSWPRPLDDIGRARRVGLAPRYDLEAMTADMLVRLRCARTTAASASGCRRTGARPMPTRRLMPLDRQTSVLAAQSRTAGRRQGCRSRGRRRDPGQRPARAALPARGARRPAVHAHELQLLPRVGLRPAFIADAEEAGGAHASAPGPAPSASSAAPGRPTSSSSAASPPSTGARRQCSSAPPTPP